MKRLALFALALFLMGDRLDTPAWAYDWGLPRPPKNDVYTSTTKLPLLAISKTQESWRSPDQVNNPVQADVNSPVQADLGSPAQAEVGSPVQSEMGSPVQADAGYGYGYNGGALVCTTCNDNSCDSGSCEGGCCGGGCGGGCHGWFGEVELLYLQYRRADGMRVGDDAGDNVDGSWNFAPRISLGYICPGGVGVRLRSFQYDHADASDNGLGSLSVDATVFDMEFFERFDLNCNWGIEGSLGVRYADFNETLLDGAATRANSFNGWGLIAGLEMRRTCNCGTLYGRVRHSILADDITRINTGSGTDVLEDAVVGISEINIGYELTHESCNGCLCFFRIGGEYQLWSNYSSAFDGVTGEAFWDGASDVGFAGISLTTGLIF